ncbi:target of rapamycin complex 1 subunit Kog1p [Trichomonascus vanleenenianus]|uniref:ubiquitin-binding TORC1 subunit KOG1 n=1 Tax=Trichomonascus vanleenenianus TaxID=2268995 RepID=UPI003ECAAE2A
MTPAVSSRSGDRLVRNKPQSVSSKGMLFNDPEHSKLLATSSSRIYQPEEPGSIAFNNKIWINQHQPQGYQPTSALYNTEIRHGFAAEYDSEQYLNLLAEIFYIYFENKRHETNGNPKSEHTKEAGFAEWRIKDRQRTVNAAIVLCLNIGVDPPDIIKTQPCAKLEAWVDPNSYSDPKKAIEQIGKNLQAQYEVLSTRTKYKQSLDPNVEDMKRFCMNLRRSAREERILFHYNGHGVPRPTPSGEIWVFNRGYTQYIPVSLFDLQTWLGAPCIYCYDCHGAGNIITNFVRFVEKRKNEERQLKANDQTGPAFPAEAYENCIQLAACRANEVLPMHPNLPADLFTCCITSPIDIAVRWFVMQSPLPYEVVDLKIPGRITDRRTPLGELNWIFTAITDTIAWSSLESSLFKRLFRQDLVVAAMFRNFLLAERIMRVHNCHPMSYPELPETHNHPMWDAWDLAVDQCLVQLPALQAAEKAGQPLPYRHSTFFEQQLTAFEYWLKYKASNLDKPPEQLPVLLQVLLSQIHRLRALILLSKYLDLGPKAVHMALSIGIFPYVLKLLQSPAPELKPVLVFIWARIMAVDYQSIQGELLKENGFAYFVNILVPQDGFVINTINVYEHLSMCAFVTTLFCRDYRPGQRVCANLEVYRACLSHMKEPESPLLRQWACLCLSQVWSQYPDAKILAIKEGMIEQLCQPLTDPIPEVRTSCILALTTFLADNVNDIDDDVREREFMLASSVLTLTNDASAIVRREIVVFFSKFVVSYLNNMLVAAFSSLQEEVASIKSPESLEKVRLTSPAYGTIFATIWKTLLILSDDPYVEVADYGRDVVDYVLMMLDKTPLADEANELQTFLARSHQQFTELPSSTRQLKSAASSNNLGLTNILNAAASPPSSRTTSSGSHPTVTSPTESAFASTLRRSVSFAANIKNFTLGSPAQASSDEFSKSPKAAPAAGSSPAGVSFGFGKKPRPVRYKPRKLTKDIEMPLVSGFFDWCCEYFQEPQMSHPETDEPGSERYLERLWRKNRNEKIIADTQVQKEKSVLGNWNNQIGFLNNGTRPNKLLYAQFEPHLVACDDKDSVTVWDWSNSTRLNRFNNSNPKGTKITEVKLINEDDQAMLLTGSSEGVVRIYRNYQSPNSVELACAWRVLSDLIPAQKNSGLIAEWQQSRGALLVGGDVRVIRVWDAPRELCTADIPARSGSPVTSLTSDQVAGHVVVAGFGDGAIRVYDRRMNPRESLVRTWRKHDSWVVNVQMQRGGARELVSGSTDGTVHLWDIRMNDPVLTFQATSQSRGALRAIDIHEHAPLIATAGNTVNLWSTRGVKVSSIKSPISTAGYISGRGGLTAANSLAFHPHQLGLAVINGFDTHISVYECIKHQ